MADPIVKIDHVNKAFEKNYVVKDLCMDIYEGEFLTILGSSGCGKTTTLRMIAGFETPTSGSITIQGESVEAKEPFERNVNTVFQNYALFPHMTIFDNIAFGLTMKKVSKNEIAKAVSSMLELVQLPGFEKRKPNQLSGGQKQRVAIARALINQPKVLLLDEPLGALDLKLRKQMQFELKQLQKKMGITFVYVTHDQEEALTMSDRIAVMNNGILEQLGTPTEIYEKPSSKFVADFIGESNIFYATVSSPYPQKNNVIQLALETGCAEAIGEGFTDGEIVYVSIRPEKMKLSLEAIEGFSIVGVVKEHIYTGSIMKTIVSLPNGFDVKINRMSGEELINIGETVYLYWDLNGAVVMPSNDNKIFSLINDVELG